MAFMLLLFAYLSPVLPVFGSVIILALSGIGLGAHCVMPHSILPDVIEWGAVETGERREGILILNRYPITRKRYEEKQGYV